MIKTRWSVRIPENAKLLVKEGGRVDKGEALLTVGSGVSRRFDFSVIFSRISKENLGKLRESLKDREVVEGEELTGEGHWFPKKIFAPISGKITDIDEFYNLIIEEKGLTDREVLSPVKAMVAKIEKDKLVLEFVSSEHKGKSLVEGKSWGVMFPEVINKLSDMNFKMKGMIVMMPALEPAMLIKAEVMGISGIVTVLGEESEDVAPNSAAFPILGLTNKQWEILVSEVAKTSGNSVLLNSSKDRLLIVNK
jgi:hypothetical protein